MPKLSKADQSAKVSQNEARRRKEIALARLREMEVAEKEGRLVPADAVTSTWSTIAGKIRDAVLRIPDKCAPALAAVQDAREARGILQAECEAILRTLSNELLQSN
jgi:phage terminase Nu1 subunit (DNA packaging protein)